ncbi:MAG TPA: sugar transferase [Acidimicrobiales bacterium]|nr:sugar transferase [Acidimicrobiales bacterium]
MSPWLERRSRLDRLAAAIMLVLSAPIIGAAALATWLQDHGPVFVRIDRVGRRRRPLLMLKIRSMRADGAAGVARGSTISAGRDPRITPVGAVLRRFRVDELPQLVHVVNGSMALLGPRPEAPAFVTADKRWDDVLEALPGIAGPTQLVFAELETTLPADDTAGFYARHVLPGKLDVDRWYVAHATPLVDLRIALGLVQLLVLRRSPTILTELVEREIPDLRARLHSAGVAAGAAP